VSTLVLKLAGPLQAWGTDSRFVQRHTRNGPSKSGILGLLAAALGRRRIDPLEELLQLRFGVRHDQPGVITRDFQTAASLDRMRVLPLTHRYYLSDAVFVAAVEGDSDLIASVADALRRPRFPLYLGRRSCPPASPVYQSVVSGDLREVLKSTDPDRGIPWAASATWRRRQRAEVMLDIVRDAYPGEPPHELIRDSPVSFDPDHRQYGFRGIVQQSVVVLNNAVTSASRRSVTEHDPFTLTDDE
jgi:CRISPR system Cascade subunit CasD